VIDRVAPPLFDIVNDFCDEAPTFMLSKAKDEGDRSIVGPEGGGRVVCVAVPDRDIEDGLPTALWVIVRVPDLGPGAVGEKVTVIFRLSPGFMLRVGGTIGETLNWSEFLDSPEMINVAVPVFLTQIIFCKLSPTFVLSKTKDEGDRLIAGPEGGGGGVCIAVPDRDIEDGLPTALWVIVRVPDLGPGAVGEKVTVIFRLSPGFMLRVGGTISETLNWSEFLDSPEMVNVAFPVFLTQITFCKLSPTFVLSKTNEDVDSSIKGVAVCPGGDCGDFSVTVASE